MSWAVGDGSMQLGVEDGVEGKRAELEVDPHGRRDNFSREDDSVTQAVGDTTPEAEEGWVEGEEPPS